MNDIVILAVIAVAATVMVFAGSGRIRSRRRRRRIPNRLSTRSGLAKARPTVKVLRDPADISQAQETLAAKSHLYMTRGRSSGLDDR
jgi:hypothetical protein